MECTLCPELLDLQLVVFSVKSVIKHPCKELNLQFLFSSYCSGAASGLALIIAFIWLKESNPLLLDDDGNKIRRKAVPTSEAPSKSSKGMYSIPELFI